MKLTANYFYVLLLLISVSLASSCRNDFETVDSTGNLSFSKDTIYLDTVFTNIGSSTYNLKVYNSSDEAISIPSVKLGEGENSNYRLNVNGTAGNVFENVEILAKDSIFIFVETTLDINEVGNGSNDFLYTDVIEFNHAGSQQNVALVTLVKDAIFLYPERDGATGLVETLLVNGVETAIEGRYLMDDELIFTNEKPYVIYGYMAVGDPENSDSKTLTVDPGARLHFHADSGLLIADNGSLHVNGALSTDSELLENEVIIEGDRLEPAFSDVPGQWGTILLTDGSKDHIINHATIKNSTIGILNESNSSTTAPNLTLSNTQIYNASSVGLLNRFSSVEASNVVINNCGQFSMLVQLGGSYSFAHCTFANYWTDSFRNTPAVFLDNSLLTNEAILVADLERADFTNCIIFGNQENEIGFNQEQGTTYNYSFTNSQIRFDNSTGEFDANMFYDFSNTEHYIDCIIGGDPDFLNPNANKLQVGENTSGNNLGLPSTSARYPRDLLGVERSSTPDFGAYESSILEE